MPTHAGSDQFPSTVETWDTSTVADGEEMSQPLEELADRTVWLKNRCPVNILLNVSVNGGGTISVEAWAPDFGTFTVTYDADGNFLGGIPEKCFIVTFPSDLTAFLTGLGKVPHVSGRQRIAGSSFDAVNNRVNIMSVTYGGFLFTLESFYGLVRFSAILSGSQTTDVVAADMGQLLHDGDVQLVTALAGVPTDAADEELQVQVNKSSYPFTSFTPVLSSSIDLTEAAPAGTGTLDNGEREVSAGQRLFVSTTRVAGSGSPMENVTVEAQVLVRQPITTSFDVQFVIISRPDA